MSSTFLPSASRKRITVTAAAIALALSCSGKTLPYAGGLMLSIQTDLAAPKDVAAVGLFITSDGRPIFSDTRDVAPTGEVRFPATIAILGDEARPRAQIKIRVVAFKDNGDVRILRDILTTVPKGRTGLLRAPLLWINEGSGKGSRNQIVSGLSTRDVTGTPDGFTKITSACPDGQTFLEGECGDATVDGDALPDYEEKDVFGGGDAKGTGGTCFDVLGCFGSGTRVDVDPATCGAAIPGASPDDPNLSFAVLLPPSAATGECRSDGCLVPLDKGSGWKPGGAGVTFPKVLCGRLASGAASAILRTTACRTKDLATPACGPASSVPTSSTPGRDGGVADGGGTGDGGPLGTQDFDVPFAFGGEPGISSVALDQDYVYLARTYASPAPPGVVRVSRADIESKTNPAGVTLVADFGSPPAITASLRVGPQPKAARALARTDNQIQFCVTAPQVSCSPFPLQPGDPRLLALGTTEAYAYGSSGTGNRVLAISYANPTVLDERYLPSGVQPAAMLFAAGALYFGLMDGSVQQCKLPCTTAADYTQVLAPPPNGGTTMITAMAATDAQPDVVFVLRMPGGPDTASLAAGGVFAVKLPNGPSTQIVQGKDVVNLGISPLPPAALAVDSTYVYVGGSFTDPRDGVPRNGLLRRKYLGPPQEPVEPFLEPQQATADPVASVAVDDKGVYWAYTRANSPLLGAKKKRTF